MAVNGAPTIDGLFSRALRVFFEKCGNNDVMTLELLSRFVLMNFQNTRQLTVYHEYAVRACLLVAVAIKDSLKL
jgi:hypothetical protein